MSSVLKLSVEAEKVQVDIRMTGSYDAKRIAEMPRLDIGKGDVADQGLDIAGRRGCESAPFQIGLHEPLIGAKRNFVQRAIADRRLHKLADRRPRGASVRATEKEAQLVPHPRHIHDGAKIEYHLHSVNI
ncbi:MAG: hypothetical protein ACOYJQ_13675 [Pseudochelatococcus sp.]|jgi:hypothetical protein|uniref:hypothetical protein n=1 Tax=Pseudochelatococcus sp. TaxID=2020869 RepID=UPI003D8E9D6A